MSETRSASRKRVLVPCELVTATVVLAPSEVPTHLEKLVLKAIDKGAASISELNLIFAIGTRPMLRLILDLLNRGLVLFNFGTGEVRLAPYVTELIRDNRIDTIGSSERTFRRVFLLRDLIAGTILPRRKRSVSGALPRIPPLLEPDSKSALGADAILREVRAQHSGRTTRSGRPLHVLDIFFEPTDLSDNEVTGGIRDLELELNYQTDPDSDMLSVTIEYPEDLPWRTRVELEKVLTRLANEDHPLAVFGDARARSTVAVIPRPVAGLAHNIQALTSLATRLEHADAGTFSHWQDTMEHAVSAIRDALEFNVKRGTIELLSTSARQIDIIKVIITSAQQQIVMACPFVHYNAIGQFRNELEQALGRGRNVFLLFGIGDDPPLDTGVANWLYDLKARYTNQLFFSERSARCHAKFVVGDANNLLLTSYNFFSALPGDVFEFGIQLKAESPIAAGELDNSSPICQPAVDLLAISRELFPEYAQGQLINAHPTQFGVRETHKSILPEVPHPPTPDNDPFAAERVRLWKHYARQVVSLSAQAGATFHLVRDAQHRQMLFDALRTSQCRLLVLSDQLSTRMVNRRFTEALEACLTRGTMVTLAFRRPEQAAYEMLMRLHNSHAGNLHLLDLGGVQLAAKRGVESHAKVLVSDDWAVISSFNFLSFSGEYEGAERFSSRTEIGLAIYGISTVDDVLGHIYSGLPELPVFPTMANAITERCSFVGSQPNCAQASSRDLGKLFDELAGTLTTGSGPDLTGQDAVMFSQPIAAWFGAAATPDVALAELSELEAVGVPFLPQAIAAYIRQFHNPIAGRDQSLKETLARELWWGPKRCSHGVTLLLHSLPQTNRSLPPLAIARLDGFCNDGRITSQMFDDVVLGCDDPDVGAGVACLAIPRVLFYSDPPLQALDLLQSSLQEGISAWAEKCLRFRGSWPTGLKDVNLSTLRRSDDLVEELEGTRRVAVEELRRCIGIRPDFTLGRKSWGLLVNRPGGLSELLKAVEEGNAKRTSALLNSQYSGSPDELLDSAVAEAATSMNLRTRPQIIAARRRTYVDHLAKVRRLTSSWVGAVDHFVEVRDVQAPDRVTKLASELAKDSAVVRRLGEQLSAEKDYRYPLLRDLIASLEPLLRLAL